MTTNSQLMGKFLRGATLDEAEAQQVERAFDDYDGFQNFAQSLQNGAGTIRAHEVFAEKAYFEIAPLGTLHLLRQVSQSTSNDTLTAVSFAGAQTTSENFKWNIADPTKIYIIRPAKRYGVIGKVEWAENGTGRRAVHINSYDRDGVAQWGYTLHSLPPHAALATTVPFADIIDPFSSGTDSYISVTVLQTSGGVLNMEYINFAIFQLV